MFMFVKLNLKSFKLKKFRISNFSKFQNLKFSKLQKKKQKDKTGYFQDQGCEIYKAFYS